MKHTAALESLHGRTAKRKKHDMNEEIEALMAKILKNIDIWEEEENKYKKHTRETCRELEMQLTALKLIVGIDKFNELPSFARYLKLVSAWNDKYFEDFFKSI